MSDIMWNAGAHNENLGSGTGGDSLRVSGTIPQGVTGAVIGLTAEPQVTRPAQILHGIQVSAGRYRAVEIGSAKTGWHDAPDPMARYHVTRLSDRVIYSVETESGGESDITTTGVPVPGLIFHESDYIGPEYSEGAASLLSPGDSVINGEAVPVLVAGLEMSFQPLEVVAANGTSARSVFEAMQVSSGAYRSGEATVAFEPMLVESMIAGGGYAFATVSFKPMQVSASIAGELSVGDGVTAVMQPGEMLAVGSKWIEPSVEVTFTAPAVGAYQDSAYTGVYTELEPMLAYSSGQRVPTGIRLGIILPSVTHEYFTGTLCVERGYAFSDIEQATFVRLDDVAIATDEIQLFHSDVVQDVAYARDELQHATIHLVDDVAIASDEYSHTSYQDGIVETVSASSEIEHRSIGLTLVENAAIARGEATSSGLSLVTEEAIASNQYRSISGQFVESVATADDAVEMVRLDDGMLVEASAFAYDDVEHWRRSVMLVEEFATAVDEYFHYDPAAVAWVLTPETAALSQHTNYQITGAAGGYAVGPEGLYRLDGDTDNGDHIVASFTLPSNRLAKPGNAGAVNTDERKRIDRLWMDCESEYSMAVDIESYDQGGASFAYLAERPLQNTGNMTVPVGKGLKSKLFSITVSNTHGGNFALSSLSADVIETGRRR